MIKTNALRLLDAAKIKYETAEYEADEDDLSGIHAAMLSGIDPELMFKTLVASNERGEHLVFMIPVEAELDLKKCAAAAGCKSVSLIHQRELLPLTGYMRGGCSPVGMKKRFPTYIDEIAELYTELYCSAGQRGLQMKLRTEDLIAYIDAKTADLTAVRI